MIREEIITVDLGEIVDNDLESFLDLISIRAFGRIDAMDIDTEIVGHTARSIDLRIRAEIPEDDEEV